MAQKLKLLRELKPDEKMAPQMKVIIEQLASIGIGKEVDRDEFIKLLEANEKMVTRQPVARILAYYMPHLKEAGLIEATKPEPAPKAEKAEKPAKTAAAPAEKPAKAAPAGPAAA